MTVIPLNEGRQPRLQPRTHEILLEDLTLDADIGFHDFEIGTPQRLLATVHVRLDMAHWPQSDTQEASWNYDVLRTHVKRLVEGRRFNLQETLAQEIFDMIAAEPGVIGLTVTLRKPDVYPDAKAVGVILSSD
ncbi:dihydroneopterin aldolase [Sandaracinobacteroides hominis]|uniref:dihydroneopterin aldolase n=1 Tax=Sandaracinobacteroides hominis TaxID=2780086 RepID=UPI0018F7696F|nr:dihydroneopterin aldolase [Sandaracinobacteroides hominis]